MRAQSSRTGTRNAVSPKKPKPNGGQLCAERPDEIGRTATSSVVWWRNSRDLRPWRGRTAGSRAVSRRDAQRQRQSARSSRGLVGSTDANDILRTASGSSGSALNPTSTQGFSSRFDSTPSRAVSKAPSKPSEREVFRTNISQVQAGPARSRRLHPATSTRPAWHLHRGRCAESCVVGRTQGVERDRDERLSGLARQRSASLRGCEADEGALHLGPRSEAARCVRRARIRTAARAWVTSTLKARRRPSDPGSRHQPLRHLELHQKGDARVDSLFDRVASSRRSISAVATL